MPSWMAAFHKYALAAAATDQLSYAGGLAHIDTCLRVAEVTSAFVSFVSTLVVVLRLFRKRKPRTNP